MKNITIKLKIIFFIFIYNSLINDSFSIDPVEIGKPFQKDIETNLSIIENLNKNQNEEEIVIKKDIRTKIKKKVKEDVLIKEIKKKEQKKYSIDNNVEKKLARIKEIIEQQPDEIQILFNSETANLKEEHKNKIINFINSQHNKKKLNFKITSYAKTDKSEDISRRLSLDRAINVRTILMNEGVPAKNLIVKSFGDMKNKENKVIIGFEKK
ncbi:MAG: hypothetical protein CFH26_00384 [Alphaproteobacteria bacterium MarineAlpha6_Bin4]|nr:MAG: hypothetical protein CFH26_00384 [Alphaproteobacteria bacterium MarineAlpha6_Bin4]|tara:strand:+ start:12262 stop:12894 length:633 start_codon:yes stop_codon:yes gene_type:complete